VRLLKYLSLGRDLSYAAVMYFYTTTYGFVNHKTIYAGVLVYFNRSVSFTRRYALSTYTRILSIFLDYPATANALDYVILVVAGPVY
jgi:hypothetical protein